jgi:hypothetical protein
MEAHMELALIILFWFALQFTLGVLFGKFIHFGMSEPQSTTARGKLQLVESLVMPGGEAILFRPDGEFKLSLDMALGDNSVPP